MEYQYKCVAFAAELKGGILGAKGVPLGDQLQNFIAQHAKDGWEYYALETVHGTVKAGCLASIFGRSDEVVFQDVAVFRKPK
jgi:hypothetical protein